MMNQGPPANVSDMTRGVDLALAGQIRTYYQRKRAKMQTNLLAIPGMTQAAADDALAAQMDAIRSKTYYRFVGAINVARAQRGLAPI